MRQTLRTLLIPTLLVGGLLLSGTTATAQNKPEPPRAAEKKAEAAESKSSKASPATRSAKADAGDDVLDHAPFEALLRKYVDGRGRVAYARWKADAADFAALGKYVEQVGSAKVDGKSEQARLAFYINAYNALVLKSVLDKWPVESVIGVDGFFNKEQHRVAGQQMTLDDLEHNKIIRVQFAEPRIHFVLVCAAVSCPRLRTTAMTADNLERELEAATREFVPRATRVAGDKVVTSQLFNWFKTDFEKHSGTVAAYLARYADEPTRKKLGSGQMTIDFSEYDWAINKQ